jgi:hypothetical protein
LIQNTHKKSEIGMLNNISVFGAQQSQSFSCSLKNMLLQSSVRVQD